MYQTDSNQKYGLVISTFKENDLIKNEDDGCSQCLFAPDYSLSQKSNYLLSKLKRKQLLLLLQNVQNCFNVQFQYSIDEIKACSLQNEPTTADSQNGRVLAKRRKATKRFLIQRDLKIHNNF